MAQQDTIDVKLDEMLQILKKNDSNEAGSESRDTIDVKLDKMLQILKKNDSNEAGSESRTLVSKDGTVNEMARTNLVPLIYLEVYVGKMGGSPSSSPIPQTLTTTPWRQPSDWNKSLEDKLLADIKKLSPAQKPSILLIGPVGAGKSSFINAILSIGKGQKVGKAMTGVSAKSFTTSYDKYTDRTLLNKYRLRDCMGIEQADYEGFHVDDIVYLVKGHVKDQYEFNPRSPINSSSEHYRADPKFENQTHCVVFVVNAVGVRAGIPAQYIRKIAILQEKIKKLRIPRVWIMTHVDSLCHEVERNVNKMFWSIKVQEAVKTASEVFNIPQASIHPVKNYEGGIDLDTATNIPLLLALRQMMQYADDRVETVLDASDSD